MRWVGTLVAAALLSAAAAVRASEPTAAQSQVLSLSEAAPPPARQAAAGDAFAQGSWTLHSYGSAAFGDEAGEVYAGHVGVGYHFFDGVSVNLELVGGTMDIDSARGSSGGDAGFGGLDLLFRWHFLRGDGWSLYADAGAGLMQSGESYPADGTHFNFRPQAGVGGTLRLADNLLLMGGARWLHVSNGYTHGEENNPGADSAMVYAGVMVLF